jgi:Methyltransferase domain
VTSRQWEGCNQFDPVGVMTDMPKMYDELASWWPLLSPASEYEEEAAFYRTALEAACERSPREANAGGAQAPPPRLQVLELGSGGGHNASHLKAHWEMVLVEPSSGMRAVSEALNPECEHLAGDMRTVRLGRQFDAVFVHDAVSYMTTEADLGNAIATAFEHCKPGGAALFAPDYVRENFKPLAAHGGSDAGMRGLRFLSWTWDPDATDTTYLTDYAYLLRSPDGRIRVEHDRHVEGLFARADWLRLLTEAGFQARAIPLEHSELEPGSHEIFVAKRPTLIR